MELKANELRIGNFINDEQTTHVVVGVDNYYIKSYWLKDKEKETLYETPIKLIKPIPLTEEWLLNFGFEKITISTDLEDFFITYYKKDYFVVYILENSFEIELITKTGKQFNLFKNFKKETHILQNLYFALTNEELKLK